MRLARPALPLLRLSSRLIGLIARGRVASEELKVFHSVALEIAAFVWVLRMSPTRNKSVSRARK